MQYEQKNQKYNLKIVSKYIYSRDLGNYFYQGSYKVHHAFTQQIDLSNNYIDDEGIKYLTKQKQWLQLSQLILRRNSITMKGILQFSKAVQRKCFPQLKRLLLGGNLIGSANNSSNNQQLLKQEKQGLFLKFANGNTKLQQLQLWQNKINDDDMITLFKTNQKDKKIFHNLWKLQLLDNQIKDKGLKVLSQQQIQYPSLKFLKLSSNKINKKGIKYLVSYKNKSTFSNLEELLLYGNTSIGDQGVLLFLRSYNQGAFPSLQSLRFGNVKLTNNGIQNIIKLFMYKSRKNLKLKQVSVSYNDLLVNLWLIRTKLIKRFPPQVKSVTI